MDEYVHGHVMMDIAHKETSVYEMLSVSMVSTNMETSATAVQSRTIATIQIVEIHVTGHVTVGTKNQIIDVYDLHNTTPLLPIHLM